MLERERPNFGPVRFSFVCPEARVEEAVEALSKEQLKCESIEVSKGKATLYIVEGSKTGKVTTIIGHEISGDSDIAKIPEITQELASRGIAGYSRATQIRFKEKSGQNR